MKIWKFYLSIFCAVFLIGFVAILSDGGLSFGFEMFLSFLILIPAIICLIVYIFRFNRNAPSKKK
tara:strand:+ start:133 stop:327 length:195 start_codon:yes stop_codon:yes gene_type:complete